MVDGVAEQVSVRGGTVESGYPDGVGGEAGERVGSGGEVPVGGGGRV